MAAAGFVIGQGGVPFLESAAFTLQPPEARLPVTPLDAVTVGEAMALFIAGQPGPLAAVPQFSRATAGAELNVAVGLARLGLRTAYCSALGADHLGQGLKAFMQAEGLELSQLREDPAHPTGLMFKTLQTDGSDPRTEYFRRGSAASHLHLDDALLAHAAQARWLHLSGVAAAVSPALRRVVQGLATQARRLGQPVSFDPNLRPSLWPSPAEMVATLNALAAQADLVLPGVAEGEILTGHRAPEAIAEFYLARGARQVVVKLGPQGAYAADAHGGVHVPGCRVARVVDTVGAGDGFAVGVVSALLQGLPLAAAAARGNAIGARVVGFPGDCDGLPTPAELAAFEAAHTT